MLKRYTTVYYPLVLVLFFGLTISFIPVSPVLGSNITACQGSGSPSSSIKLSGRTITPTLILQAASGTTCPTGETSLGLVTLSRTIIVSPVLSSTQNGTALLSAMTLISNSNPSASNPWLLKLEPGQYDLGNQSLTLLPYVDLEGSGEGTTTISSTIISPDFNITAATLIAASHSEVRFLTIANTGPTDANYQAAVTIPNNATNTRFTHFTAIQAGGYASYILFNPSGTVTLIDANLVASGSSVSTGLYNSTGNITSTNSTLNVSASTSGFGFFTSGGNVNVTNSTFNVFGGATSGAFVTQGGGNSTLTDSTFTASGGSNSYGVAKVLGGTVLVFNSRLSGPTAATNGLSGTDCTYSINGTTHAPLNASCQ